METAFAWQLREPERGRETDRKKPTVTQSNSISNNAEHNFGLCAKLLHVDFFVRASMSVCVCV